MQRTAVYIGLALIALGSRSMSRGQPSPVAVTAITNSASYAPSAPEQSGIAQGSLFIVFGYSLGPAQIEQSRSFPLQLRLAGSSVQVQVEGSAVDAIMIYTSANQLAAVLPSRTPVGNGTLTVTYNGMISNAARIKVVQSAFGIYTAAQNGRGPGVVTDTAYRVNRTSYAANPGETLTIWGTGAGPVSGDETAGPLPGKLGIALDVFVGTKPAKVRYAGRSGCCAGLDQVSFDVPAGTAGCFVPLAVRAGGVISNFASVSIAAQGRKCNDAAGIPVAAVEKAGSGQSLRVGAIALGQTELLGTIGYRIHATDPRTRMLSAIAPGLSPGLRAGPQSGDKAKQFRERVRQAIQAYKREQQRAHPGKRVRVTPRAIKKYLAEAEQDTLTAGFLELQDTSPLLPHLLSTISAAGSCSVFTCASPGCGLSGAAPGSRYLGRALDAGPQLTLSGPPGLLVLPKFSPGQYGTEFASAGPSGQPPRGDYTVMGPGGTDVGSFTARLSLSGPLTWTNKDAITAVDRTRDLTVTWNSDRTTGYVVAGGLSSSHASGAVAMFLCGEKAAAGSFTIPSFVLSAMPADEGPALSGPPAPGYLFLAVHPLANTFTASGIDFGYFSDFSADTKKLPYQ